jgi:uncharacterized protein with HEPN domain
LIHGYSSVRPDEVWQIVRERLPVLRETVSALLVELGLPEE